MAKEKVAAPANKGGKQKKKKWGTSKVKDKLNNVTTIDQKLYDRIIKDGPTMNMITIATFTERFKVSGAISRRAMKELLSKDLIERVGEYNSSNPIYHGLQVKVKKDEDEGKKKKGKKGKKQE
ncbi:unnamed protein product [Moneuplotes crassus]|uniref:40S ribosomal protein S25 n=1 Tax=Euplotes crassus TaxID=5936 RepID=A0AAD1Y0A9_EUPCR|nr:unnamed protein product [Moneuplotes crassus]CAI2382737.1 unnamed protein product [Moneuplotes crassus]CAI2382904.1 unnamed protein product [Moneuplotes crassus]CAI2382905.1 unnamed protein product [Moneuplotes crassus]|eukprot:CAMPEP_0197000066 /NCGR_PEP_ID=MMETSP1380-20130617/5101_1 /TAXON_ID=5936 /ORGANISM="Euplotes crassus, Strain CT5" /LENGTH=122 /DNA_ID=CAMNT_0042417229 /DNA_START=427 /DNA_END=795 /DNA_ORIENTATION=-